MTVISLLHATYRNPEAARAVCAAWFDSADRPGLIDYVIAADTGDPALDGVGRDDVVFVDAGPYDADWSTAVRNWNAAASRARGDLLFVIADDLLPPAGWDRAVREILTGRDPKKSSFVVKIGDSDSRRDALLRHPIVSRRFYSDLGLWNPAFKGVYCDRDITARAFWRSIILDARSLHFDHRNPLRNDGFEATASHKKMNRQQEYELGLEIFCGLWPDPRHRNAVRLYQPTIPPSRLRELLWTRRCRLQRLRSRPTRQVAPA